MTELARTNRSRVKRLPKRGGYDFETVAAILDAGFLCHVGYVIEGDPYVTPTSYWREGDHVYWHGSSVSRMLGTLETGTQACLTVAHIDGLVLARSGFHHSINYRSVMLFGRAHVVDPLHRPAAGVEPAVFREDPDAFHSPVGDPEEDDHVVRPLELDRA